MAVVWARKVRARQWKGEQGKLSGQKVYRVLCNDKNDDPDIAAAACPAPWSSWSPSSPGLIVSSIDVRERDEAPATGGALYDATLDYSTTQLDPSQQDPNPLNRPVVVELSFDSFEETVYKAKAAPVAVDSDGNDVDISPWHWKNAVVNSTGDAFDPSISDCFRDPVLTITKNVDDLGLDIAVSVVDTVNANDFSINYRGKSYKVKAEQAWLYDLNTSSQYENGIQYESVRLMLKLRKDGWRRLILDQGLKELNNGDTPARAILDANGNPVMTPALLNGKGAKLPTGTKNPVWLKWRFKGFYEFETLPYFGSPLSAPTPPNLA